MLATIIGGNIAAPSTSLTRRVLHTILTKAPVLLLLLAFMASTQSAFAATAGTEFNTSANGQKFTLTNDASAAKPMTQDIVDSAGSVSVLIWGPVLAAVLGGIIIWIIVAINQGGVRGAINGLLALVIGGLSIALVYTYMIAKSAG